PKHCFHRRPRAPPPPVPSSRALQPLPPLPCCAASTAGFDATRASLAAASSLPFTTGTTSHRGAELPPLPQRSSRSLPVRGTSPGRAAASGAFAVLALTSSAARSSSSAAPTHPLSSPVKGDLVRPPSSPAAIGQSSSPSSSSASAAAFESVVSEVRGREEKSSEDCFEEERSVVLLS
ncbi:Os10g0124900, partial [Oryza sativa Japonica Group]